MKNFNDVSLKGVVRWGRKTGVIKPARPARLAPSMVLQGTSVGLNRTLDAQANRELGAWYDNIVSTAQGWTSKYITPAEQAAAIKAMAKPKALTLKSVAKAGARAVAKKAPALAQAKSVATAKKNLLQKGVEGFNTVFSGAATWVSNTKNVMQATGKTLAPLYGAAQQVAAAVGVKLPAAFQGQLSELDGKISALKTNAYIAQSYVNQALNPLLQAKTVEADALAKSMGAAINDAQNAIAVALTKLSIAKVAASSAQNDIMRGVIPDQALAAFGLQYRPAEQAFNEARLKFQNLEGLVSQSRTMTGTTQKGIIARTAEMAQGAAQAVYQTGAEAGGQLLKTAEDVGKGVTKTGSMMQYLPYFIVGGVALYIYSVGRSTGSGMGKMFESVGEGSREALRSAGRRIERFRA